MKFKFKKKYVQIGIISFCVIAASLLVYYFLFNHVAFSKALSNVFNILSPVIYGFIFAFLMTPILNFIEKKIIKVLFLKWKLPVLRKLHHKILCEEHPLQIHGYVQSPYF